MKSANEIAQTVLVSEDEFERRATSLKRVASSVRSQLADTNDLYGLSEKERKVLAEAGTLLEKMSQASKSAAKIRASNKEKREARVRKIQAGMAATFGTIDCVAGKVALITASSSYRLKYLTLGNFEEQFAEVLSDLPSYLSFSSSFRDLTEEDTVKEAWALFIKERPRLEKEQAALIASLEQARS